VRQSQILGPEDPEFQGHKPLSMMTV
jgi:hypothetical protein